MAQETGENISVNEIDFYIDTEYSNINSFDCNFDVFNIYLKQRIPKDKATFHYIINSEDDSLIAYFSLLASCVLMGEFDSHEFIPAIELKMFAIDKHYQKLDLSSKLVAAIIDIVEEYSSEYVGAELLILYSVPAEKVVDIYETSGFKKLPSEYFMYKNYFSGGCIAMYKKLLNNA